MTSTQQIALHLEEVYFGGNWTAVNVRDTLEDVSLEMATTRIADLNTIAHLTHHMGYYLKPVSRVLAGGPLSSNDEESFVLPRLGNEEDWERLIREIYDSARDLAHQISSTEDKMLPEVFCEPKYGSVHRNLLGVIEHTYYHLGQITLIKKLIRARQ